MDFDNSWDALLNPGEATWFFVNHNNAPFEISATGFSKINAWWLAELSRLIYKNDSPAGARQDFLAPVGLRELEFFETPAGNLANTKCALVTVSDPARPPFAVLVFRGTADLKNALTDIEDVPIAWEQGGQVYAGFLNALNTVWQRIETTLNELDCPLFYTGHSLGAALATLAASRRPPRALYTFGSPFVGDAVFTETLRNVPAYRVVNNRDVVATLPPHLPIGFRPTHAGELHYFGHDGRMLVNPSQRDVEADWRQLDTANPLHTNWLSHFINPAPPEFLSDHTPVNYVAQLARVL